MAVIERFTVVQRDRMQWYFNNGGKAATAAEKLRFGLGVGVAQGA
jgi:hypothetical protein